MLSFTEKENCISLTKDKWEFQPINKTAALLALESNASSYLCLRHLPCFVDGFFLVFPTTAHAPELPSQVCFGSGQEGSSHDAIEREAKYY